MSKSNSVASAKKMHFDEVNQEVNELLLEYHKIIDKVAEKCFPIIDVVYRSKLKNNELFDDSLSEIFFESLHYCIRKHDHLNYSNFISMLRQKMEWKIGELRAKENKRKKLFFNMEPSIANSTMSADSVKGFIVNE